MSKIKELFKRMDGQETVVFVELEKALTLLNTATSSEKNLKKWREFVSLALRFLDDAEKKHTGKLVGHSKFIMTFLAKAKGFIGSVNPVPFYPAPLMRCFTPWEQTVFKIGLNLPSELTVTREILEKLLKTPVLSEDGLRQELKNAESELKKTIEMVRELFVLGRRVESSLPN